MKNDATSTVATVLARLRAETRPEHEAIEAALGLDRESLTHEGYQFTLGRFYGFYVPVEDELQALGGWSAWGLDLATRTKAALLATDLRALGVDQPERLPMCLDRPALTETATAFGCLYVMEGATLGGQVLSRLVAARLGITAQTGGRFFQGYGAQTGPMWKQFCQALEAFAADQTERQNNVIAAATATFRSLQRWCAPQVEACA